jgi:dTDP-4-dehydrorhamnose 3,5-epimerase
VIITTTPIPGVAIIDLKLIQDDRGFFARSFCRQEFIDAGLEPLVEQCNLSYNHRAGTLRGMHFQVEPAPEAKLVRCTRGAIVDVIVDLRPASPTRLQHVAVELTADNRRALYVPPFFAHGYQTLTDDTEVTYQVSGAYTPGTERGLRHDDPALGLSWPVPVAVISAKDAGWPLLSQQEADGRITPAASATSAGASAQAPTREPVEVRS